MNYTAEKLKGQIVRSAGAIADILAKGKDVELRKTTGDMLKIVEVTKKVR